MATEIKLFKCESTNSYAFEAQDLTSPILYLTIIFDYQHEAKLQVERDGEEVLMLNFPYSKSRYSAWDLCVAKNADTLAERVDGIELVYENDGQSEDYINEDTRAMLEKLKKHPHMTLRDVVKNETDSRIGNVDWPYVLDVFNAWYVDQEERQGE